MANFRYVYGTVPSRRMGVSVGISPIAEGHCNYSCIYCQLGRTRNMTNKRKRYFDYKDIIKELMLYLSKNIEFDVATIVGDGEPLLYADLGILINELKLMIDKPVAVITNGSLLYDSAVRDDLKNADIILPSLDASNEKMFREINRPHGDIKFDDVIKGLRTFSEEYKGQLWIETMIVEGINDNKQFFLDLKELLGTINYHKLYINSPVRPPAESFVKQVPEEVIEEAVSILGGISIDKLASEGFYSEIDDDYDAVLSIIKRHPMNQFEIRSFVEQRGESDVENFFERLNNDDNIEVIDYKNYHTYRLK